MDANEYWTYLHLDAIWNKVYDFYCQNRIRSAAKLLFELRQSDNFPKISLRTSQRNLKCARFWYEKCNLDDKAFERPDVIAHRHAYLRTIRETAKRGFLTLFSLMKLGAISAVRFTSKGFNCKNYR